MRTRWFRFRGLYIYIYIYISGGLYFGGLYRYAHSAVSFRGLLYIYIYFGGLYFGGLHPGGLYRYAHSAVSFRGLIYVFGGYGGNDEWLADLWVLDTQASATAFIEPS